MVRMYGIVSSQHLVLRRVGQLVCEWNYLSNTDIPTQPCKMFPRMHQAHPERRLLTQFTDPVLVFIE